VKAEKSLACIAGEAGEPAEENDGAYRYDEPEKRGLHRGDAKGEPTPSR
jgi:hypothetical protein